MYHFDWLCVEIHTFQYDLIWFKMTSVEVTEGKLRYVRFPVYKELFFIKKKTSKGVPNFSKCVVTGV